ncbi:MAG: sensor histidine kinase N-terminal domain-containing protein [Betaproteobacteria bacterium]|nr:sensor histidine kinase N-terminal domain-containing protein [Betaproteobacteria bacterium]MDH3437844.1 sensor histidine kinase N-terminal domain-containing protein [Betaproteobacteria bacterium]
MLRTRTLRRQLIAWLSTPLVVLWSISIIVNYDIAKQFVNLAYDRALLEVALDIGRNIKRVNNQSYLDLPAAALQMLQSWESGRLSYRVTGANGEYISGEPSFPKPEEFPESEDTSADRVRYYDDVFLGRDMRVVAMHVPVEPGSGKGVVRIQVAERVTLRTKFATELLLRMVLPQALLIFLAMFAVWYGVGRGLAPLSQLQRQIEHRSHRDLSPLLESTVPREVQPLIHAMNGLLERLSASIAAQQRFIADAAHQLRTPIAGLKTQTELALRQTPATEAKAAFEQLHTAIERMARLVNQLLWLARAEPDAGRASATERINLTELAREATTDWVPQALARNIDLGFEGPPGGARIEGDPFLLREMLNNLLDNAIRYTQSGGHITVRVNTAEGQIILSVEDDGPGVPEAERERVFERFYRVLGTSAEGCGLGLAIVREIAQRHRAEAALTARGDGTGTIVRVVFSSAATAG